MRLHSGPAGPVPAAPRGDLSDDMNTAQRVTRDNR